MTDSTSMISIGREPKRKKFYECGSWILIRPAHSSREFSVFAEERKAGDHDINHMAFVTNSHVLTQFAKVPDKDEEGRVLKGFCARSGKRNKKTVVFCASGEIKPQKKEV